MRQSARKRNLGRAEAGPRIPAPVQPLVAAINCTLWVVYGFFKKERDLPVVIANLPGILFGIFAALTAF